MRPVMYLNICTTRERLFAMVCVWIIFVSACYNMDERDREEAGEFICGMIVADFVDSVFDHD